jgi:effector-binding domain-containing protein
MRVSELLLEGSRKKDLTYSMVEVKGNVEKVIVKLEGSKSGSFTTIAKNYKELKTQIEELEEKLDVKNKELREKMEDLFDPADEVLTRVVETCQLQMMLTKPVPASTTVNYEVAFNTLVSQLADMAPELNAKLAMLVDAATKAAEKAVAGKKSSFKVSGLKEGVIDDIKTVIHILKRKLSKWVARYDRKLSRVKAELERLHHHEVRHLNKKTKKA